MAVIGEGLGTTYPVTIDTGQTFDNIASPIADTDKRSDSEVINDLIALGLAISNELGTDPAGASATVKARFDALGDLAAQSTINDDDWSGADLTVPNGGMGASSYTDGGLLLGSGTGPITAMGVLANGAMIVGDGAGDPVAESGTTLRTSIGVPEEATKDNMEAEATGALYAPSDLVKHSPGVAKAWAFVPIAGTSFTAQYNMSSVSKGGTGIYNYVIATDFSTADYAVVGMGASGGHSLWLNTIAAGTFGMRIRDNADSEVDAAHMVACFGDQ